MSFRKLTGLTALASTFVPGVAFGQAVMGDLLVAERFAGSIVNAAGGGDLEAEGRFATGLAEPTGMCRGPGGHIYVAEYATGEVTIVTAGGDFARAAPFASGLTTPLSLACDGARVLVAEFDSDEVTDVSAGGDFTLAAPFASAIDSVKSLLLDSQGRLWAGSGFPGEGIFDITAGGDFGQAQPHARNQVNHLASGLAEHDGALYATAFGLDKVVDFTLGGDLDDAPILATYPSVYNLADAGSLGLFASDTLGNVYEIAAGGSYTAAQAYATGLASNAWGMLYVHGCGDGVIEHGVEVCDDAGDSARCNADCSMATCGDGLVNAAASETCDDGAESSSCDADCTPASCGDGVTNTSAGERCDDANTVDGDGCSAECNTEDPDQGGNGGSDDSGDMSAPAAEAGENRGCACSTAPRRPGLSTAGVLFALAVAASRMRRRGAAAA
jgi:cysteine-rich repeat protein